jgi:site-specific recombinase XerD
MFESLFTRQHVLARHCDSPCAEFRARYLVHCADIGYPRATLQKIAWVLQVFSQSMDLCIPGRVTHQEIEFAVDHRASLNRSKRNEPSKSSRRLFIHVATNWLRFLGCLEEPQQLQKPFAHYIDDFAQFMCDQRGLSPVTIKNYYEEIANFLAEVWRPDILLNGISIKDVDTYLAHQGNHGWGRASLHQLASALRVFFCYAEGQGWTSGIAAGIEAPRLYAEEGLPLGPTWEEVQKIIASFSGNNASDIRNRAIVLLLAIYGLRRGEVARLRLDDVDWIGEILHVSRPKQRCTQQYPLVPVVGDAILLYLKEVRPRCSHRELFLSLEAPIDPLKPGGVSAIVRSRLKAIGIQVPRRGAHCLRHACARHLLDAGFSLKEIGDHLGHRSATATRVYTKVDLIGLRQVAELELGSLL